MLVFENSRKDKAIKAKIAKLNKRLESSVMHELITDGIFKTIVDGVDSREAPFMQALETFTPKLRKGISTLRGSLDTRIDKSISVAMLESDTSAADFLMRATQYSDLVARYAVYKYRTREEAVDKDVALEEVSRIFISYDENTSPALQYANDMGLFMFTKFFLRIQAVLTDTVKNYTSRVNV